MNVAAWHLQLALFFPSAPDYSEGTYSLDSLDQSRANHHDRQSPPAKRRDCDFTLDTGQSRALLARLLNDANAPRLFQKLGFELLAHGVGLRVELRKSVCQRAHRTAESVVFPVVHRVLEEISLANMVLAVVSVGLIGVEVDLLEKPSKHISIGILRSGGRARCILTGVRTHFFSWCLSSRTILAVQTLISSELWVSSKDSAY